MKFIQYSEICLAFPDSFGSLNLNETNKPICLFGLSEKQKIEIKQNTNNYLENLLETNFNLIARVPFPFNSRIIDLFEKEEIPTINTGFDCYYMTLEELKIFLKYFDYDIMKFGLKKNELDYINSFA